MPRSPGSSQLVRVRRALQSVLGLEAPFLVQKQDVPGDADLLLESPDATFVIEWKAVGDAANVGSALRQLTGLGKSRGRRSRRVVPIVAVPFMGETGRRLCDEAGVSWIDLSGNAWITAPGHNVRILGHPNRFTSPGRPPSAFAPKSSRVVRTLLMAPERAFTQAELARASGTDKARVSRLVRRLEAMGLLEQVTSATIRLKEPSVALEAWREAYDFEKHEIRRGHVAVRTAEELVEMVTAPSYSSMVPCTLTGLAAAWYLTRFAAFRLTTAFVREPPPEEWLEAIGFRDEPHGANLWLVRPVDEAVFEGARVIEGVSCAHPLQVYLDLKAHPERAREAADELRRRLLNWSTT
jgi:hypothetical protein